MPSEVDPNKPFAYTLPYFGQQDLVPVPSAKSVAFTPPNPPLLNKIKQRSPTIKKRIIKFSKIPFRKIAEFFHNFHDSQIPLKLQYVDLLHKLVVTAITAVPGLNAISKPIVRTALKVTHILLRVVLESKVVNHILNAIKLFSAAAIPFALYDIASNLIEIFKGSIGKKIEAMLQIISDTGIIGECVGTFALGLEKFGAVSAQAVSWVTPLFAACLMLSFANVALHLKSFLESTWLLYQLNHKVKNRDALFQTVEDYQPLFEYLLNKKENFYSRHFKINSGDLSQKLDGVWKEAMAVVENPQSTLQERQAVILNLKSKVKALKVQKVARVVVSSILIGSCFFGIAAGFVVIFTPTSGVVYGLMVGGLALSATAFVVGTCFKTKLRKSFGIPKKKNKIRVFCERPVVILNQKRKKVLHQYLPKVYRRVFKRERKYAPLSLPEDLQPI